MAAQTYVFNAFLEAQADGTNDFTAHTYKAALMDSGYSPDIDNDEGWNDVSADEVTVEDGYVSGGLELADISITRYDTTNKTVISWGAPTWTVPDTSDGLSDVAGLLVYNDTLAGKLLIAYFKFALASDITAENYFTVSPAPSVEFQNGGT